MVKISLTIFVFITICFTCTLCSKSRPSTLYSHVQTLGYGPRCSRAQQVTLTASDKAHVVAIHNNLRRKIAKGLEHRGMPGPQPPAADMRELTWDEELAKKAQTWANQCTFQHDPNPDVRRFGVGQNLYMSMNSRPSTRANWEAAIHDWYNEVGQFNRRFVYSFQSFSAASCGHYSAMVWANTNKIGCAVTAFQEHGSMPHRMIYICNYGPAGNFAGASVYRVGRSASACPRGTRPKDGLCA